MPSQNNYLHLVSDKLGRFMRIESSGGLILLAAAIAAMLVKNSPLTELYQTFLNLEGQVRIGTIDVNKPLFLWVNDLWMAVFFFVVGLEIKNEWLYGYFVDRRQIILPAVGALGGVAVPALVYIAVNWGDPEAMRGWAIPTATDIAFALAVLAALSSRVPSSLKVLLMTLAVLDDLAAIVVIAVFYSSSLSMVSLVAGAVCIGLMIVLRGFGVQSIAAYLIVGSLLWVCVLKSGVHATLAGVVTAFLLPSRTTGGSANQGHDVESSLDVIIDKLHPWIAFGILPAFAFVNAGIAFEGMRFERLFDSIPLGIMLGLIVGKPIGVFLAIGGAIVLKVAKMPSGSTWMHLFGIAALCGVGFTMSLFIAGLAFAESGIGYARIDRLAILLGSFASALLGYVILRFSPRTSTTQ
jgi:Na+:H+ antiporter, NhaA family